MLKSAAEESLGAGFLGKCFFLAVFLQMGKLRCEGQPKVTQALGRTGGIQRYCLPLGALPGWGAGQEAAAACLSF